MAVYFPKVKSIKGIQCWVTAEPMFFLYFLSTVVSGYVGSNMLLHKACDPNATTAPDLEVTKCLDEKMAQHNVASILVWKSVIQELVSLTILLFAGPWSDIHGRRRRPLMFIPVCGQILCDTLNILFAVFWQVSPTVAGIAQSVTVSTTGTFHCFLIGMFAFLSDVTDETNRTMRIGFASAVVPLGGTVGALASGYLNVKLGFTGVFILCIGINVVAIYLGLLFIYDTSEPYKHSSLAYKTTYKPNIVIKCFKTAIVKRDHNKRIVLILMIIATPLTGAPFMGEMSLMYLYLRNQFGFKEVDFSLFKSYTIVVMLVGSLFSLGILSRILKMNDALIGLIATFFDLAAAIGFFLVTQLQYLYYVPPFEIFRGAALSLVGAIASKCVEPHELGSMNSIRMVTENLSKSAIVPLYSIVYNKTLETLPNAYFIISILLTLPLIGCFAMTYLLTWNQETELNRIQASDLEVKLNNFHADSNDDINLSNTDELLDK